ncbi:MAG: sulfatase-like hydrolase/transferase [Bacteroidetes bacterium]|nr:sulfatase-like hydrolase/transferase [Bacteroidota bacterium]
MNYHIKIRSQIPTTYFFAIVLILIFISPLFSFGKNSSVEKKKRPSLLFIMTDQQRFDALSYAGNKILKTPNMDRLAKEGVYFKNAHTQCAVCTPARASILTGHAVANTKVISNKLAYVSEETGIMPMQTYDEVLAENGYECEYYGKWHTPTFRARIYKNPVTVAGKSKSELGLGKKAAYLNYLNPYYPERELKKGELKDTYTERPYLPDPIDLKFELERQGKDSNIKVGQSDIHGVTKIPAYYHISAFEAGKTIQALEKLKDKTFSLTCSFHHPHPPYLASEKYIKMYPPRNMVSPPSINDDMINSPYLRTKKRTNEKYSDPEKIKYFTSEYYAMVKEVDDWVGNILNKLDELGLTENTLVVFTSDHGEMLGNHGLRGKFCFYEESSHVPMIIRFPGRIKPKTTIKSPVSNMDLFATILDYLEMPDHPSDGESLRNLIENGDNKDAYVVTEWLSDLKSKPSHMVLKDGWKLMLADPSATTDLKALYNLNEDPYELKNLLGSNPEYKNYASKVAELESCFQEWIKRTTPN